MKSCIYMFRSVAQTLLLNQTQTTLIVFIYLSRTALKTIHICQNLTNPNCFFAASDKAINSASVVESETHVCFLHAQLTTPPFSLKIYPEFDFLSIRHSAQFASAYPINKLFLILLLFNCKYKFCVPFKYFKCV